MEDFNIYLGLYIVAAIIVISGGSMSMFRSGRMAAAILFIAGAIGVFTYYGIRWFGSDKSVFSQAPVPWPPTINTCPDYLIYYKRQKTPGQFEDTCIDKIGVSKNGNLKKIPDDGDINDGNDEYFFSLATKSTATKDRLRELCRRCIQKGLTWEGICNGESCSVPDAGGDSGGDDSKGCPAVTGA
jgi:hypothetical protein